MKRALLLSIPLCLAGVVALVSARQGASQTHRLEATPETVAYGYYWSEAKPVLRIASGDIVDVDTLLTNTPQRLAQAGVADDKIEASLKAITTQVTGERRGPGGHILTGPVYVEGAEPGDALEVKIPVDIAKANARSSPWRRGQGVGPTTGLASVPMPS